MGHLVEPIRKGMKVGDALDAVKRAHAYWVELARKEVVRLNKLKTGQWGTAAKRVTVKHVGARPDLVPEPKDGEEKTGQPLVEVMNQCATMERLIDALTWANREWPDCTVKRSHPTTSSDKRGRQPDNDLILVDSKHRREYRFEVSDVAAERDGNQKELKDLVSLRVVGRTNHRANRLSPNVRVFLVVSKEFSNYLTRNGRRPLNKAGLCYATRKEVNLTRILEVVRPSHAH